MESVTAGQLRTAARVADALVYTVGVAGVIAGGLLLRRGDLGFAVVAWSLTFVAGAGLRLGAWVARGVAELLVRQAALYDAVNDIRADRIATERRTGRHWD
jgi:hypothetical protein